MMQRFWGYSQSFKDWDIAQSRWLHNGWAIARLSRSTSQKVFIEEKAKECCLVMWFI